MFSHNVHRATIIAASGISHRKQETVCGLVTEIKLFLTPSMINDLVAFFKACWKRHAAHIQVLCHLYVLCQCISYKAVPQCNFCERNKHCGCCWPVHTLAWLHIVCFHRDQHQWETPTTDRRTASVSGEPKRNIRVWKEEEIKKCKFRFEPKTFLTHTKWPKWSIVFQRCMYIDCACIHYFYPLFFF